MVATIDELMRANPVTMVIPYSGGFTSRYGIVIRLGNQPVFAFYVEETNQVGYYAMVPENIRIDSGAGLTVTGRDGVTELNPGSLRTVIITTDYGKPVYLKTRGKGEGKALLEALIASNVI
ncbi:hypothetical protein HY640_00080 [Candidatus Woesearchaeota archaeon]|nr:hypothetical protein [Candidatus Woesearchaeota archaeon]